MSLSEYQKAWEEIDPTLTQVGQSLIGGVSKIDGKGSENNNAGKPTDKPEDQPEHQSEIKTESAKSGTTKVTDLDGANTANSNDIDSEEDEEEEPKHSVVIKIMEIAEMRTQDGRAITTKARRLRKPKTKKGKFEDYTLILRRQLNEMGIPISMTLEVKSPFLRNLFKEILSAFEHLNLDGDIIMIPQPFEPLYYQVDEIRTRRQSLSAGPAQSELDLVLEFFDLHLVHIRKEYDRHVVNGRITSELAWALFPPNEIILLDARGNVPSQCGKILNCTRAGNYLQLRYTIVSWNGQKFGNLRRSITFPLPINAGSFLITDLIAYPLKFHSQADELRHKMIERGRKYTRIVQRAHMKYDGVIWKQDPIDLGLIQVHVSGRVMIDYAQYVRNSPSSAVTLEGDFGVEINEDFFPCTCGEKNCKVEQRKKDKEEEEQKTLKRKETNKPQNLSDEEALCCPGFVQGFALRDKVWAEFRVDHLKDIDWNGEAYKKLEMDTDVKEVIRALVKAHRRHSIENPPDFDDLIAGKGLGLVFLLQGEPGLGKTLTAESVAEESKKPLYAVTSGELGTTVTAMEKSLAKAFLIAKEWNAILLIDEADVFMSKRSADTLEKNAFVSVFLRLMEYYQGIMFLTTNRAEDFDPAFTSRIHLIIEFQQLDAERRSRIWKNLAAQMRKDRSLDDKGFEEVAQYNINGREIKNMLRTAWSLAKYASEDEGGEVTLTLDHLRTVARIGARAGIR